MITRREREVLELVAKGLSTKEIAAELNISFRTAVCHRSRLREKVGARNTAELVSRTASMRMALPSATPAAAPSEIGHLVNQLREDGRQSRTMLHEAIAEQQQLRQQSRAVVREFRLLCEEFRQRCWSMVADRHPEDSNPGGGLMPPSTPAKDK